MPENTPRTRTEGHRLLHGFYAFHDFARRRPLTGDALVGLAVVGVFFVLGAPQGWVGLLWSLPWLLAYCLRSISLPAMLGVMAVTGVAQVLATDLLPAGNVLVPLAVYRAASSGSCGVRRASLGLIVLGSVLMAGEAATEVSSFAVIAVILAATLLVAWLLGDLVRHRRTVMEREMAQYEALARDREQRALLAIRAERSTIAREMHDIIAHSLSVVIVQADGGRYAANAGIAAADRELDHEEQDAAREAALRGALGALEQISDSAREALAETRRLVGVLRDPEGGAEYTPGQTLADLPGLLDRMQESSLPVQSLLDPALAAEMGLPEQPEVEQVTLPRTVSSAAFRVVQEATTNVIKHAGAVSTVRVRVKVKGDRLVLTVADDGAGPTGRGSGDGHGILGMHERVIALGGELTTGMRSGGGFLVRAEFPLTPPSPTRRRMSRQVGAHVVSSGPSGTHSVPDPTSGSIPRPARQSVPGPVLSSTDPIPPTPWELP
ncbi:Signal transduction histidine kinase [Kytococcus aerolatus]|uniref:histidine kinase n=1 Tax=Kytococcus aerolatus TaxID=592308 RepID=A0A212U5P3_9MICO|nr:histidine kinase [Kytococcus aerolatus]SNC73470.1 Signal transduction histidine kinase [Kytococcus aerolatus]